MTFGKRNFLGGFVGGILGILACAFIHPATLPFGCLLGVVSGFWYREIWEKAYLVSSIKIKVPRYKIESLNQVHFLALSLLFILSMAAFLGFIKIITPIAEVTGPSIFCLFMFIMGCVEIAILNVFLGTEITEPIKNRYETRWSKFFWNEVWFMLKLSTWNSIRNLVFILYAILSFLTFAIVYFIVGIPVGIAVGILWALKRSEHWFCFGTTLLIPTLTAWVGYSYWVNPIWIWISALVAGMSSGTLAFVLSPYRLRITKPNFLSDDNLNDLSHKWMDFFLEIMWEPLKSFFSQREPKFA